MLRALVLERTSLGDGIFIVQIPADRWIDKNSFSPCRRVHIHGARHRFSGRGEEIPAGRAAGCPRTEEQSQVLGWKLVRQAEAKQPED